MPGTQKTFAKSAGTCGAQDAAARNATTETQIVFVPSRFFSPIYQQGGKHMKLKVLLSSNVIRERG